MVSRAVSRLDGLPANVRGIAWMCAASACYACVFAVIRWLADDLPVVELVFIRAVLGIALMTPLILREGLNLYRTPRIGTYIWRSIVSFGGMVAWFYGLSVLPLADATSLMFTLPIFTVILAVLFLGEQVGIYRWAAVLAGFAGVLIILRPGFTTISVAALAVLFTAVCYAAVNILTKTLTDTEPVERVVFHMFSFIFIWSAIPAAFVWVTPDVAHIPWILALGGFSYLAQQALTRAFAAADTSVVVPFTFLQLPIVAVIAYALFSQQTDPWTWAGAAVIVGATTVIAQREARAGRRAAAAKNG